DLWDEIGMKPDTWEDIRVGGAKLKAKGNPVGIALGHSVDPNLSYRSMLWSYGASECDETGKKVTLDSKQTLEVVKFVRALYKEAMEPEVLSWDDASNNRYLASGRASWIHNPISAYRSIQKATPDLADKIHVWKTPAGPVRRLACGSPNSYAIWKFAKNKEAATEFLRHYADHGRDSMEPHVQPPAVPQHGADADADPVERPDLAPAGQADHPANRRRLDGHVRLSGTGGTGLRRGGRQLHHLRHDGEGRDRQGDAGGSGR